MMKAHGIAPNAATVKAPRGQKREKDSSKQGSPSKKAKEAGDFTPNKGSDSVDDEERFSVFPPIKTETNSTDNIQDSRRGVKEEADIFQSTMLDNEQLLQYMPQLDQASIDSFSRTGFEDSLSAPSFSSPSQASSGIFSHMIPSQSSSNYPPPLPQSSCGTYSASHSQSSSPQYSPPLLQTSAGFSSSLMANTHNSNNFSSPSTLYDLSPTASYPHVDFGGGLNIRRIQTPPAHNNSYSGQNSIVLD